jgi:23S rRNA (uracil-5-)-methyltransferase RumA
VTSPPCPVFGACGGCSFQDVPYEEQVATKRKEVLSGFQRFGLDVPGDVAVESGPPYGYRNRMDFVFSPAGLGQKRRHKFAQVVPFETCPISNPRINGLLAAVNAWHLENAAALDDFNLVEQTGTLRYATIRSSLFSGDSTVTFILNADSTELARHEELIARFADRTDARNVLAGYVPHRSGMSITDRFRVVKGREILYEVLFDKRLWYHSQGFFQNNSVVTEKMIEFASRALADRADVLVDLYGGVGTFGLCLNRNADEVIIVENNGKSTDCAELNIRENAAANVRVVNAQAEGPGGMVLEPGPRRSVFVVDPPRPGLHRKVLKYLKTVRPERIVYVSCNPAKQAEDIYGLQPEFRVSDLRLFDMFPQTPHCESVALLERAQGNRISS